MTFSLPLISTSLTQIPQPVYGAILGYSSTNRALSIIGGRFQLSDDPTNISPSTLIYVADLTGGYTLYDVDNAPISQDDPANFVYSQYKLPNLIADNVFATDITQTLNCENQCATQIGNLLYIVNPIGDLWTFKRPSHMMVIYDVDTYQYQDQSTYNYNIPDPGRWNTEDTGCVVNDGTNIYVFGNHESDVPEEKTPLCPDGDDTLTCPITELYVYSPSTDSWSTLGDFKKPNINWRYQTGCAMSTDNQYLYIFGGIKRYDRALFDYDVSIRETEKYDIANDEWTILPSTANLTEARWSMFSYVSFTDNHIYLYGGFRMEEARANFPHLDSKIMTVFDITTESVLDLATLTPEWDKGHWLGLSNTIRIDNTCDYELALDVGSYDFNEKTNIEDISLLRFTSSLKSFPDSSITINSLTDIENIVYDAYDEHNFQFEIIVTSGAAFIPSTDINNYDFLVTDWEGRTLDIDALYERYKRKGNGVAPIVTIESVTEMDIQLFNACNSISNVVKRIEVNIRIRPQGRNNYLCGQTRLRRLRRWFFRDSDPDHDGENEWTSSVQLEIINPSNDEESVLSDTYVLTHDCTVSN